MHFTVLSLMYFSFFWLIYFIIGGLYFYIHFTYFIHSFSPFLYGNHQSVLCFYETISVLFICWLISFVSEIPHIREIMQYISFSDWVISHHVLSIYIHVGANGKISIFLWLSSTPLCITSSLFTYWWTLRLIAYFGYYK